MTRRPLPTACLLLLGALACPAFGQEAAPPAAAPPAGAAAAPGPDAAAPDAPAAVARRFYEAFCAGDTATLEALYAPDVRFRDPIFTFSDRAGTMGMWRVLLDPASGGVFSYELLGAEGDRATVRWEAHYRFPTASFGRRVHNVITATLVVRDGRIVEHVDDFPWDAWVRQALPLGRLATWSPLERLVKATIRRVLASRTGSAPAAGAPPAGATPRPGIVDRVPDGK